MAAAAASGEIERIIMEINQLLPNMRITRDDILNPKHEFVSSFCEQALNYYDNKIGFVVSGEERPRVNTAVEHYVRLGYGPEVARYVRIKDITKCICSVDFTIIDFYKPTKQRTKAFLGVVINFLLYIDSKAAETARQIVVRCFDKIDKVQKLEQESNALLENINRKITNSVNKKETLESLRAELIVVNKEYHEMLKLKKDKEESDRKVFLEVQRYKTILNEKSELLNRLTKTERDLRKKIVLPEELQSVTEMEEQLKEEQMKLKGKDEDYAATARNKQEDCDHYIASAEKISNLNFDCFNVLHELKDQQLKVKEIEQKCTNLTTLIQAHGEEIAKTKADVNSVNKKKQQLMLQKEKMKQEIIACTNEQKVKNEIELNQIHELQSEREHIKLEIAKQEETMDKQKKDKDLLTATFEEQYKMALEIENKRVANFNKTLDAITETLQSAQTNDSL